MSRRTIKLEYYRLWAGNQGDSGTWDTDVIEVPADTPVDRYDEVIREAAAQIPWRDDAPVIVGHYSGPRDEDELEIAPDKDE
jgi:hypothetical protein